MKMGTDRRVRLEGFLPCFVRLNIKNVNYYNILLFHSHSSTTNFVRNVLRAENRFYKVCAEIV